MNRLLGSLIVVLGLGVASSRALAQHQERITWNFTGTGSQSLAFYDGQLNYTGFKTWYYSGWRLVGAAGNRILWQEQVNAKNATFWKIDDDGNYISHVALAPPAAGYKARSLALAPTFIGECYQRGDYDQRYFILWEKDTPSSTIYLQWLYGNGSNVLGPVAIQKPAGFESKAALAAAPILGGPLVVLFANDASRTSLWKLVPQGNSFVFQGEWLLVANPIDRVAGGTYVPASVNTTYDSVDGAVTQILFNDGTGTPFNGRAAVLNVRDTSTIGHPNRREIWLAGVTTTGWTQEATAHTIVPSACP